MCIECHKHLSDETVIKQLSEPNSIQEYMRLNMTSISHILIVMSGVNGEIARELALKKIDFIIKLTAVFRGNLEDFNYIQKIIFWLLIKIIWLYGFPSLKETYAYDFIPTLEEAKVLRKVTENFNNKYKNDKMDLNNPEFFKKLCDEVFVHLKDHKIESHKEFIIDN